MSGEDQVDKSTCDRVAPLENQATWNTHPRGEDHAESDRGNEPREELHLIRDAQDTFLGSSARHMQKDASWRT